MGKQTTSSSAPIQDEEQLAFWDLCKKTNSTPQLINKYQRFGIVSAPADRKRGLRQLYDSGAFSEVVAANFLKQFFSLQEVADIRKLEHAIGDVWKKDDGSILDRTGDKIHLEFFFIKDLWFSLKKNWEKTTEGKKFEHDLKKYAAIRQTLLECLKPLGDEDYLKKSLNPIKTDFLD